MIQIKVDGELLFKGELTEWENKPPDQFKDMIKPGRRPDPWMKAMLVTLSDAVVLNADLRIRINTTPKGWVMTVVDK